MNREEEIYRSVIELRQDSADDEEAIRKVSEWLRCTLFKANALLRNAKNYEEQKDAHNED